MKILSPGDLKKITDSKICNVFFFISCEFTMCFHYILQTSKASGPRFVMFSDYIIQTSKACTNLMDVFLTHLIKFKFFRSPWMVFQPLLWRIIFVNNCEGILSPCLSKKKRKGDTAMVFFFQYLDCLCT